MQRERLLSQRSALAVSANVILHSIASTKSRTARRSSNDAIFACRPVGRYFDVGAGRLSLASATLISPLLRHSQRERGLTSCTAGETGQKPFSVLEDGCSRSVPQR